MATLAQQKLQAFFLRSTPDPDSAQDLLQETLLAMIDNIAHLKEADRF